jgi:ribosomal protein S18 acetylase RimI-like enzyme
MTAVLPEGCTIRPPEPADAEAIFALIAARNSAAVGIADYTLSDMIDELAEPGFDLTTDAWLVFGGDILAGYGSVFGKGDHRLITIEVVAPDPVVGAWLLEQITRRAAEMGRKNGHADVTVDAGAYRQDEAKRDLLAGRGFRPGTTFHRMRVDHLEPLAPPEPPPGVRIRRGAYDDAARRAAHSVFEETFDGQFGFVRRPYEMWYDARESRSTFDWSQLTLLEVAGRPVAVRECTDEYLVEENCGYIRGLGVLEDARGKGLARFLLRDAFYADAAAGRSGTILHVDTNNPTPALGLYLSVGMRATIVIDVWRLVLPV